MISTKQGLTELYFKATSELRINESLLAKNFSITLLNQCYQIKALIKELENILGTGIIQVP